MSTRRELANAIRALSMDAVQQANSGHPGMPMGMADIAEVLWNDFLKHNPTHPRWINRDRFILSNGHGSMLLYALLHLTGYDLPMEQLRRFRQLHSKTPGHPEFQCTPGVETTTGPLGQGLANAVGMAIAERSLAAEFNRDSYNLIDHYTYVFAGDGCMMEGISHEVSSLAGLLGLGKLIVFYDDNGISIDGATEGWFIDDTPARFAAYNWHVIAGVDGHHPETIRQAILQAQAETEKPSLICCHTTIGFGAPNLAGSAETHGAPLGEKEVAATRNALNWRYPPFEIPAGIYQAYDARAKGRQIEKAWQRQFDAYTQAYPTLAHELLRRTRGELPQNFSKKMQVFISKINQEHQAMATRKAGLRCLQEFLIPELPELIGGSCDLGGSNGVFWKNAPLITKQHPNGRYLHYGVREFGMMAINNGIALHRGLLPFGATFLTFVDYGRNAVRLAAMMQLRSIYVFSHDSIGLGEDGPTHQPIEHASMLRLTPNLYVWRPADAVETGYAWRAAIERQNGPTALLTTRQTVPFIQRDEKTLKNIAKGGYVLKDFGEGPQAIIIATGSEVELALKAAEALLQKNIKARVVSMPCCEVFDAQSEEYKRSVLLEAIKVRVAIEAGSTAYWHKYVGLHGEIIGIDRYGASAPAKDVYEALGITVEAIEAAVLKYTLNFTSKLRPLAGA